MQNEINHRHQVNVLTNQEVLVHSLFSINKLSLVLMFRVAQRISFFPIPYNILKNNQKSFSMNNNRNERVEKPNKSFDNRDQVICWTILENQQQRICQSHRRNARRAFLAAECSHLRELLLNR